ncbi:DUF7305 domain-containing protein [Ferdinandcohnia quinoae]|uniref:Type 4 fimbrial biogenesis protein PilX N-terminal domain-containing protein n=1 Tax=Fredinandcohnia quinoae TaxID=2918902 RepID=A0AAW5ECU7_9BACI|nr:PilX N-terminal domain-containing pilus assembly protein [Fredinandcohnia sp. SECRCQ15]MCH1626589.1 hypothetical protein [Fredinandcohnia sp. SECRCQ15]
MRRFVFYNKYFKNEHGLSLFIVLLVLVVISIMGISLMSMATSNIKMNASNRDYQSTYYIAEAGATKVLYDIEKELERLYNENENKDDFLELARYELDGKVIIYNKFEKSFGKKPIATVTVKKNGDNAYLLTSVGKIGNSTRTVETIFVVKWTSKATPTSPIFTNRAVYSDSCIELTGSASIDGNVGLNGNLRSSGNANLRCTKNSPLISVSGGGNKRISGNIYISKDAINKEIMLHNNIVLPNPKPIMTDSINYKELMPAFPLFPNLSRHPIIDCNRNFTLVLNQDYYIPEINIFSNSQLNINVGNSDKEIVVDNLNITNGHINLLGSGKLIIYVTKEITLGAASTINENGDSNQLTVYYKGSRYTTSPKEFTLGGSQKMFGSLFAEDANIRFTAGSVFQGNIYSGGTSFIIDGSANAKSKVIFAPNADFQLLSGASIKGSIIVNSFYGSGGSKITFEQFDGDDFELPLPEVGSNHANSPSTELLSIVKPIKEK